MVEEKRSIDRRREEDQRERETEVYLNETGKGHGGRENS